MAYTFTGSAVVGLPPIGTTQVDTTNPATLAPLVGRIEKAYDPTYGFGEFIFLKGVASTAVGSAVEYSTASGTTALWQGTAGSGKPLAFAMSANVANQYDWYQISGNVVAAISGTVAAGDKAFYQANGVISTTQVNGKQVLGCVAAGANGTPAAGFAVYTIQRPHCQGQIV